MLALTMRSGGWCLCVIAVIANAGCGDRPLSVPDAVLVMPPDASVDALPTPGSLESVQPTGVDDPLGGATDVGPLAALSDGGVIVAGTFSGTVVFAPDKWLTATGMRDGFVARYRSDGRLVWVHPVPATGGAVVMAGAATLPGDEVVIGGWFSGTVTLAPAAGGNRTLTSAGGLDGFVARLASDGSVRWAVREGGPGDDIIRGLAAAPPWVGADGVQLAGKVVLTGAAGSAAVFGPGEPRQTVSPPTDGPIFVASLSPDDGTLSWVRFAGGGVPSQGYGVTTDGVGNMVAVTGYVNGPAPFGAGTSGAVTVNPSQGRAFVAVWDGTGRFTWARGIAGAAGEGDAIDLTPAGDVVVTGTFEDAWGFTTSSGAAVTLAADSPGQPGCFLAQMSGINGGLTRARRLAGRGLRPWHLHRFAGGSDLLIAGSFGGGTTFDPDGSNPATIRAVGNDDAVFLRLDATGALRWATILGGPGDDEGSDVTAASDGLVWAAGRYIGPVPVTTQSYRLTLNSGTDGSGFLLHVYP